MRERTLQLCEISARPEEGGEWSGYCKRLWRSELSFRIVLMGASSSLSTFPPSPICVPGSLGYSSLSISPPRWLFYPKPYFEDTPCILEPGEYPTSEAWGALDPTVGSLKPMRLVRSKWSQVTLPCRLWGRGRAWGSPAIGGISPTAGAEGRQGVGHF